jgi:hypothetical protein
MPLPIVVLMPSIGFTFPALLPIVTAVAAAKGYGALTNPKGPLRGKVTRDLEKWRRVSVPLERHLAAIVSEEVGPEQRLNFAKDDLVLVFRKDATGKFFVEVGGPDSHTAREMREIGEAFALELVKKFAYHRLAEQLTRAGATVFEEQVHENGRITLKARKWS